MADRQTELVVPEHLDGERVDRILSVLLGVSRSVAVQLVEQGVTADGVPVRPATRLPTGAMLVSPPPIDDPVLAAEPVPFEVVFEDEDVIVVDKPAGLVVHPGVGRLSGTLVAGLLHRYPELAGVGQEHRWGLVHRLDKDTSGLLLVARNQESYRKLTAALKAREVKRVYLALAHGTLAAPTGTIDAPIGRDPTRPTRRKVTHDGKPARTHYEVLETFPEKDCSLLKVSLETGRTHQIRVHLSAIDHPVVGDRTYGVRPRKITSPRMFLHAAEIGFSHPSTGAVMTLTSPLPQDLRQVLDGLRV